MCLSKNLSLTFFQAELVVINSTITGNTASDVGAFVYCSDSKLTVTNSTIKDNMAGGRVISDLKETVYCAPEPPYTHCKTYGDFPDFCPAPSTVDPDTPIFGRYTSQKISIKLRNLSKTLLVVVVIVPSIGCLSCFGCFIVFLWVVKTRKPKNAPHWARKLVGVEQDYDILDGEEEMFEDYVKVSKHNLLYRACQVKQVFH